MSQTFRRSAGALLLGVLAVIFPSSSQAEGIKLAGTGAATEFLRRLGSAFTAQSGVETEVVPGMGSGGALKAMGDDAIDVVAAARPLNAAEIAKGLTIAYSMRTPFVFATSHPNPNALTLAELRQAYASPSAAWQDGEPIRVILRPKHESDTVLMELTFAGIAEAMDIARQRPDIPIAATDQDNAELAEHTPGSLVGMTYLQDVMENRNLRLITLDGVEPTLENYERGLYPYGKKIDFVLSSAPKPAAQRFIAYVRSIGGAELYRRAQSY